jgi:hypothetical protein
MWNGKLRTLAIAVSLAGCGQLATPSMQPSRDTADYSWTSSGVRLRNAGTTYDVALPGWLWAGEPYTCGPALAFGPKGEIIVTSDVVPTLWRIDPQTRAVSVRPLELDADRDMDIGFSSISYSAKHGAYFAISNANGSLWRIDPLLRRAQKTALSAPLPRECGMAWARIHPTPDQRFAWVIQK